MNILKKKKNGRGKKVGKQNLTYQLKHLRATASIWLKALILQRFVYLELTILLVVAIVGGYLAASFLFFQNGDTTQTTESRQQRLTASVIDELELWIEERHTAYQNPPAVPAQVFNRPASTP